MSLTVVYAREPLPAEPGASVFLAGPTPRRRDVPSWRPAALAELAGTSLTVFSPESRHDERPSEYHHQVEWEAAALEAADVILFWIPRDLATISCVSLRLPAGPARSSSDARRTAPTRSATVT